jgi:hypothetical protein
MDSQEVDLNGTNPGGGSGGDTGATDAGNQVKSARGVYQIGGNQVVLVSRIPLPDPSPDPDDPPSTPPESRIILLAAGSVQGGFIDDGTVDVRGCKGVRVSAGPLSVPMISPGLSHETTDGVDIICSETQKIKIQRGMTFPAIQSIIMEPDCITIDAGLNGALKLQAGMSQIVIDTSGITIIGVPMVVINPGPPPPPDSPADFELA